MHLHCSQQVHAQSFAQVCELFVYQFTIFYNNLSIGGTIGLKKVTRWDEVVSESLLSAFFRPSIWLLPGVSDVRKGCRVGNNMGRSFHCAKNMIMISLSVMQSTEWGEMWSKATNLPPTAQQVSYSPWVPPHPQP